MDLLPKVLYEQFASNNCTYDVALPDTNNAECAVLENLASNLIAGLNPYDLFRETYYMPATEKSGSSFGEVEIGGEIKRYQRGVRPEQYAPWIKKNPLFKKAIVAEVGDIPDPMGDYLNRADVRAALHIPISVQGWEGCTTNPLFNYPYSREASIWIYRVLRPYGYQMMHYSGDTDGVVPTIGTRKWIASLGWEVTSEW